MTPMSRPYRQSGPHATEPSNIPGIITNVGAGPVLEPGTREAAAVNAKVLADDLRARGLEVQVRPLTDPTPDQEAVLMGGTRYTEVHDGRYPFCLQVRNRDRDTHEAVVEIPALPINEIRPTGDDKTRMVRMPRLFVDGSSWWWPFAVDVIARDASRP